MKKIYYLVCACVFSTVFHLNAQTTCADAIPFDWSSNNTQEAETTVWYKVSLTPLKNEEGMDLKLYINNASATETANVSCTVYIGSCTGTSQDKSTVIVPAGNKDITLQRSLIEAFGFPNLYIKMTTNQKIVFSANIVPPEITSSTDECENAIDFDWNNGHIQGEGTSVFYRVDISDPKTTANKAVKLTLENFANTNASVVGEVTFTCQSGKGTSYTKQLSANQKVEKVLSHAFLESLNITEVYVKVSTSAKIYIAATIFDEETSAPDYACESAINFDWTNGHAQPAGEQWYRVDMATLRSKGDVKLSLYNDESSNTTVIAEVAFECPTTDQLLNQGVTLKASEKKTKVLKATDVNALDPAIEYVFVKLSTSGNIHFVVTEEAVTTDLQTADKTAQNLRLTTLPSAVRVTSLAEQTIKIYSLTGTCLFHNNMHADETVSLSLPEGIYIVQSDTETHKIIVF